MVDSRRQFENLRRPLRTLISRASQGIYRTRGHLPKALIRDGRGSVVHEKETVRTLLTPEQSENLADDFRAGIRVMQLATKYGVNRNTVHAHLNKHGLRRPKNTLELERVDRAIELYLAGMTLYEVGQEIGSNKYTVQHALESRGISRRPRGVRAPLNHSTL